LSIKGAKAAGWRLPENACSLTPAMDDALPARLARQRISMRREYRHRCLMFDVKAIRLPSSDYSESLRELAGMASKEEEGKEK
jgi:hypothetical protein